MAPAARVDAVEAALVESAGTREASVPTSPSIFAFGLAGTSTRISDTLQNFSSGCCEIGSTASLVTAFTHRSSPCTSFQCIGAKQLPGSTRSVTTAGKIARPRRERTSTASLSRIPSVVASSGCISTNGAGLSRFSMAIFPVLVIVCHWC